MIDAPGKCYRGEQQRPPGKSKKNTFKVFKRQSMPFMKFHQEYIIIMSTAYCFVAAFRWYG